MASKILEIYSSAGDELLYTFGNEEDPVKYGEFLYGEKVYDAQKNDGVVLSADAFFEADALCAVLTGGEVSLSLNAWELLNIPKNAKAKLYRHTGELLVTFIVKEVQRSSTYTYIISGYDYIGIAEDIRSKGFYIENKTLEFVAKTAFSDNGIPIILNENVKEIIINGSALPNAYSLREVLQYLCVGYSLRASTIGYDGIYISTKNVSTNSKEYTADELMQDPTIDTIEHNIGTMTIKQTQIDTSETKHIKVHGYVKANALSDQTVVTFEPGKSPIDTTLSPVRYDVTSYVAGDGFRNGAKKRLAVSALLDARVNNDPMAPKYVSDYATAVMTANNGVEGTIDHAKLKAIAETTSNDRGSSAVAWLMRPTISDFQYALVAFRTIEFSENTESSEVYEIEVDDSANFTTFETPFVSNGMVPDIESYYAKKARVTYGCKYDGENLFDMAHLPRIYEKALDGQIEKIDISYGAYSVFATITAIAFE